MANHPIFLFAKSILSKTKKIRTIAKTAKHAYMLGLMLGHIGPSSTFGLGIYCLCWLVISSILSVFLYAFGDIS